MQLSEDRLPVQEQEYDASEGATYIALGQYEVRKTRGASVVT
jgi:hypothetical protein